MRFEWQISVIDQFKGDQGVLPRLECPAATNRQLLLRQCKSRQPRAVLLGQKQRHATLATPDIQDFETWTIEHQLRCDMHLLFQLRLFESLVSIREIGARILPIMIEHD